MARSSDDERELLTFLFWILDSSDVDKANHSVLAKEFFHDWKSARCDLGHMEMRFLELSSEEAEADLIAWSFGRAFTQTRGDQQKTWGNLVVAFFESHPRTVWMKKVWPDIASLARKKYCGSLWPEEELVYYLALSAWLGSKESQCCPGYVTMASDMAWKLKRCHRLTELQAMETACGYVRVLKAAGLKYKKLLNLFLACNEDKSDFQVKLCEKLGPEWAATGDRSRMVELLLWFVERAREKGAPN